MNTVKRLAIWASILTLDTATAFGAATEPVLDVDFPDPFILATFTGLRAYATNTRRDGRRLNVQTSRSPNGVDWTMPTEAMPSLPAWVSRETPDIWAPEVLATNDGYVLYFSARHATRRRQDGLTLCVGAARAARPEGPFTPRPKPLTCGGPYGVIDPSPFRAPDGLWLYVKADGNCCRARTVVLAQRLSPDGLRLRGAPTRLVGVTNDQPWESDVVEAPQMMLRGGRYYLFYSANSYAGGDYAIGYALCDGPAGPCRDAAENPVLRSSADAGLIGPGHQSLFQRAGRGLMAYHGWRRGSDGRLTHRALYIDPIAWAADRPRLEVTQGAAASTHEAR